ncbi:motility protein A [Acetivibrio ethanolgignens]|uniref:Flagellar motor protein MotP n=1 Tax=Acetivibrio ethanolgignens TaxID=290052 RepID=A0A0V8QJJ1_9FIRM|nr:motility protein A [Acetivibrio ethanolgignens]KSV60684.1 flagellar motor protein MotP [Acetivibrio ethanolgignens]
MDIATLIGLVLGFGLMIFGMVFGKTFSAVMNFIDPPSILITIGGTFSCLIAQSKDIGTFVKSLSSFGLALKPVQSNEAETIQNIINLSNVARKEGLLALEEAANGVEDDFLKKGILLIVDGTDPELVRGILETELSCIEDRHGSIIGFWENMAAMGPAWGMIGTLIGLINMLKELSDMASVGPNMAVALVTTFYGSLIANWIATPVANKLKMNNATEVRMKEVMVEGLLSIQAGENPRVIEEKLKSFMAPSARGSVGEGNEGGEA